MLQNWHFFPKALEEEEFQTHLMVPHYDTLGKLWGSLHVKFQLRQIETQEQ